MSLLQAGILEQGVKLGDTGAAVGTCLEQFSQPFDTAYRIVPDGPEQGKSTAERAAAYRSLFTAHFDQVTVDQVRRASQTGMALGTDRFKEEIENLSGRRVRPLRRGPKVKSQ